jgi:hypothetical protein
VEPFLLVALDLVEQDEIPFSGPGKKRRHTSRCSDPSARLRR